jgi:hypothetical protein
MDKVQQMQVLCAKIGVFFANCDGVYETREQEFIENFVANLEQGEGLTPEIKQIILGSVNEKVSLETIIQMTKDLLDGFNEVEQTEIKKVLSEFIVKLIEVDGEIHPNEIANYNLIKEQIGL